VIRRGHMDAPKLVDPKRALVFEIVATGVG
jgi:hypothetical protein